MSKRVCPECQQRPVKAKGLCAACYKRLLWRPTNRERELQQSRAWKAANRERTRAYDRVYDAEHKAICPQCGGPRARQHADGGPCLKCIRLNREARLARIVELYNAGVLLKDIAAAFGLDGTNAIAVDVVELRRAGRIGYRYKAYERKAAA